MSFNHPKAGPNLVGAYQMSGIPFVTSSVAFEVPNAEGNSVSLPVRVEFPFVTKWIKIRNTGLNDLRVGFSENGVLKPGEQLASDNNAKHEDLPSNYFLIPTGSCANQDIAGSIQTFDIRCKELYFLSNATKNNTPADARNTSFSLIAGLTPILASEFPTLTGSNGFVGAG